MRDEMVDFPKFGHILLSHILYQEYKKIIKIWSLVITPVWSNVIKLLNENCTLADNITACMNMQFLVSD